MTWSPPTLDAPRRDDVPPPTPASREWTPIRVPDRADATDRLTRRRLTTDTEHLHGWARRSSGDFVVFHTGPKPDTRQVERMIDTLVEGDDPPSICIADDRSNELLSRLWQVPARRGVRTATIRTHADPLDRSGDERIASPMVVIRRSRLDAAIDTSPREAWKRPSWWAAALTLGLYGLVEMIRTLAAESGPDLSEQAWLPAVEVGSASGYTGGLPSGSSAWPALMEPVFDLGGINAVRIVSLMFALVTIGCSASAASRLFGRWAARLTTVVLSLVFAISAAPTSATPTMLAAAALSVALLGIALAESVDRPSWLLMSGGAVAFAIAVEFQTVIVAAAITPFFLVVGRRDGRIATTLFATTWMVCVGWWAIPLRDGIRGYADAAQVQLSSGSTLDNAVIGTSGLIIAIVSTLTALVLLARVKSSPVRRRVIAIVFAGALLPTIRLAVGAGVSGDDVVLALVMLAPAFCGLFAHQIAAATAGREVVPRRRDGPDLLTNDSSSGRFDGNSIRYTHRQMALAGMLLVAMTAWFVPWALAHTDWGNWWLAIPFVGCNVFVACTALLLAFNNSKRSIPLRVEVARGHEPLVGVIVPTASEPVDMVMATVGSVIDQRWPEDRLRVVVSDDGYSDELQARVATLAAELPHGVVSYFRPPKRGSAERIGESKAGNLNAAIRLLSDANCEFVETRDADDLVADPEFLRLTVSHMMLDDRIGFVQTIKESKTSEGDPFNNNELLFYRGMMLSRNADHCAFPCGSGLVWRRAALREIGHFPVWNLVEDIHSGVLALRLGWRGLYVPIVGAFAQHAPEDVANYFKQRGTWAIDSIRLFAFDRFRHMPWRMRLHFIEQTAFYLLSLPIMVLLIIPMAGLAFGQFPIDAAPMDYAVHFTGFAVAMELTMLAFAADRPLGAFVRTRVFLIGMAPLYAASTIRAFWYGAKKKPIYIVTRKTDEHRVYVSMLKAHWFLIAMIVFVLVMSARRDDFLLDFDPGSIYWAIVGLTGLGAFVRLSWFGVDVKRNILSRLQLRSKPDSHVQSDT
ncbi:glycosyltransferase [Ilumatobacter coccineus]|nr:glycosyltransferase [Ilumatobacter coccineus]